LVRWIAKWLELSIGLAHWTWTGCAYFCGKGNAGHWGFDVPDRWGPHKTDPLNRRL